MENEKIKELEELAAIVADLKKKGKRIVQCHGCFDIIHFGHIKHFLSAKKEGDILIVTVTPDRFVRKGPDRPLFNEQIRTQMLAAVEYIDYVALNKWETAVEAIKLLEPDVYVKGKEVLKNANVDMIRGGEGRISNLSAEEVAVKSIGGRLYLTDELSLSSSKIINELSDMLPQEAKLFLRDYKKEFTAEAIFQVLQSLQDIKVLVIGDTIVDEYTYCLPMEKSGKENLVSSKFISTELQAGGALALANHTSKFSKHVHLVTCIGGDNRMMEFITEHLDKSIDPHIVVQNDGKTIVKKRYIEEYRHSKLFEIYNTDTLELSKEKEEEIIKNLKTIIPQSDLIIVGDYGHGLLTDKIRNMLIQSKKFLAINAQLNSGNLGYNFITQYRRADFVSLNERELRLPLQEAKSDIKIPIEKLSKMIHANKINITRGKYGIVYYQNNNYYQFPALTQSAIDTMGAGDAVLSISSLLAYKNASPKLIPFLGNCVGSLAVKIMGNRNPIDPIELNKVISYILK